MPVVGLPTALEVTLGALLQQNRLTSWKIAGEGDNTTVVIRLKSDTVSSSGTCQQGDVTPQVFRRKPPSSLARDQRRAEERRTAVRQDQQKASDISPTDTSQSLFLPTPPTSIPVSKSNTLLTPNNTPMQSYAHENRRAPSDIGVLDTARVDLHEIDLVGVSAVKTDCENDSPLDKVRVAGYSVDVIRDYVSELRKLQRKLRNTARNQYFIDVFSSDDDPDTFLCESDNVIFRFTWTAASNTPTDSYWFFKRDTKHMTQEERSIHSTLQLWAPADRGRMKHQISRELYEFTVVMEAVRFLLG
ncbi:hypothetical protein ACOMHN_003091 [Nucella lapillus]